MHTILVAGGAGFIGSNLCKHLLKSHRVICVDNLYTGKIKNIESFLSLNNFIFINHDIIEPLIIDEQIDEIYHLACPASPEKYQSNSIYTMQINFIGTMNLLNLAKKHKCKILLASTSEIYGEPLITPQNELYNGNVDTISIRSCYDEGKRIAETLFMEYYRKYNIQIRIVRIFNTYGPNMDINDGRVVTNFIKQLLNNDNCTIYGNGTQTRSFCYIDDLIDGLIKLMGSTYIYPMNLGNTNEITINELANILKKIIDSKSKIVYKELPQNDPTNRKPDISLAKRILNWEPKVELIDGLQKTINYLKNNY